MTSVIHKYPLLGYGVQLINMPAYAKLLTVQVQGKGPQLWAVVDTDAPPITRKIVTYVTGQKIDDASRAVYVGTFQIEHEDFVGHVFDLGEG